MSGGSFDYIQYRFDEQIEEMIRRVNNVDYSYSDVVKEKIFEAIKYFKMARIYLHRVDWFVSCDDGEETFLKRLEEDIKKLEDTGEWY